MDISKKRKWWRVRTYKYAYFDNRREVENYIKEMRDRNVDIIKFEMKKGNAAVGTIATLTYYKNGNLKVKLHNTSANIITK